MNINARAHALATAVLAAAGALAAVPSAAAGQPASAQLVVRARVLEHVNLRLSSPEALTLTEADIARGYVDVPSPVQVTVESNVAEGYVLVLQRHGAQVRDATVQGPAGSVLVGEAGTALRRPATGASVWREVLDLRVRFSLSPQATAGTHAWPLHISMMSR